MFRRVLTLSVCGLAVLGRLAAQEVVIVCEVKPKVAQPEVVVTREPGANVQINADKAVPVGPVKAPSRVQATVIQIQKPDTIVPQRPRTDVATNQSTGISAIKSPLPKPETVMASSPVAGQDRQSKAAIQSVSIQGESAFTKLADGFDFPVGKPDAKGYYKARGFRSHGHLGEDWDGLGGGDTDLGDPIYCIGDGVVVFARDCKLGWGDVIIVRHAFREGGRIKNIDSFYGHLQRMLVHQGQTVARGQQIATMGNARGLYDAHLHLEIRKNIEIGMSRAAFARDFNNYFDPTQFIMSRRTLRGGGGTYRIAMNTFTRDQRIRWDRARRFSGYRGGSGGESAVALKKALATQGVTAR
jgi:murein DD-endopeptidase MepM/ murein hydrolase activator NlpD